MQWPGGTKPPAGTKLVFRVEALETLLRHAYTRGASDALAPLADAAKENDALMPDFMRGIFR